MQKWEWVALNLIKLRVCGGGKDYTKFWEKGKGAKRHQLSDRTPKDYINYLQASLPQSDFQSCEIEDLFYWRVPNMNHLGLSAKLWNSFFLTWCFIQQKWLCSEESSLGTDYSNALCQSHERNWNKYDENNGN